MNAPVAKININEPYSSGIRVTPNSFPEPSNSRQAPSKAKAQVNPNPIPISLMPDSTTLFFAAYVLARPNPMQFTTINGI